MISIPQGPALRVLTAPRALAGSAPFLAELAGDSTLVWAHHERGMLGFGEATRALASGPTRFASLSAWFSELAQNAQVTDVVGQPGTGLSAFASFGFSRASSFDSRLVVPEIQLGRNADGAWITWATADPAVQLSAEGAEARLAELVADSVESHGARATAVRPGRITEEGFQASVHAGVARIRAGEVEKIVLARDAVVQLDGPTPVADTLRELSVRYVDCWTYGVDGLIGATPEMLIQVLDGTARARVLAGTLDRAAGATAGDDAATASLVADAKQRREHQFAIDSFTEALGPLVSSLEAPNEPFVLQLPNVWHLASDVRACLAPRPDGGTPGALDLLEIVHPTAAVCGTPRTRAGEIIRELEAVDRGAYAGPVGWVDAAGNGEFGIALRGGMVERGPDGADAVRLWAGCGIVADSEAPAELAETWAKMRPMLQALGAP
ncbi:isochorismate synthase [Galactobacter caseinivorans]|uniref:isochorismate synthase n=1 Tax=Galactobacter caseinivorans TaxID=2676123 RepID=A0A496PLI8_9MICC|nr:isochorismate synthase [Galactobacter caseinivorans]RKW71401.1 isochorismate synthase [Galactobacter caseinivorans]